MAISEKRKSIYRKFRKLGFHTVSEKNFISLHRWRENKKAWIKKAKDEVILDHDVVSIHVGEEIYLSARSEQIDLIVGYDQTFDIDNFNLSDYRYSSKNKGIVFNGKEIKLLEDLYHELLSENGLTNDSCSGCIYNKKFENEIEYGYNSPCTCCKRRANDNYKEK